jgi:hypothetical protein
MPEAANPKHRPVVPPPTSARGTSSCPYAELDVTTNFSFLRGASHPDELVYRAAELGYTAIAVTDINSVAGERTAATPVITASFRNSCPTGATTTTPTSNERRLSVLNARRHFRRVYS